MASLVILFTACLWRLLSFLEGKTQVTDWTRIDRNLLQNRRIEAIVSVRDKNNKLDVL
jgi:hypothetical protein